MATRRKGGDDGPRDAGLATIVVSLAYSGKLVPVRVFTELVV